MPITTSGDLPTAVKFKSMDQEHQNLVDFFYEKISTESDKIARDRIGEIEEEYKIVADGLSLEDQLEFWRNIKREEVDRAKGEFKVLLKDLSEKNFAHSHSNQSSKDFLQRKYNLSEVARLEFIHEQAYHYARIDLIKILKGKMEALIEGKKVLSDTLKWTGNPNSLVQLIYGLHCAKKINNGEGEITKIIKSLFQLFDLNKKNLLSNHSKSIHDTNRDYAPSIFKEIEEAYVKFRQQKIEDKKSTL